MKILKGILLLGTFVLGGCCGLSEVNASRRSVDLFSEDQFSLKIDEPDKLNVHSVSPDVLFFANNLFYDLKSWDDSLSVERIDRLKSYRIETLMDIAQERRSQVKTHVRKSQAFEAIGEAFKCEKPGFHECKAIAIICSEITGKTIPRIAKRSKCEMLLWIEKNWPQFCPIIRSLKGKISLKKVPDPNEMPGGIAAPVEMLTQRRAVTPQGTVIPEGAVTPQGTVTPVGTVSQGE